MSEQQKLEALGRRDPYELWRRYRRRLATLLGQPDVTTGAMRKAAQKILGRPVTLLDLRTHDLAQLVVALDAKIAARGVQLSVAGAEGSDSADADR